jgi:hypothetical protein
MKHPRAAFGVTPCRGRQLRPGKAGSALAWTGTPARPLPLFLPLIQRPR